MTMPKHNCIIATIDDGTRLAFAHINKVYSRLYFHRQDHIDKVTSRLQVFIDKELTFIDFKIVIAA